MPCFDGMSRTAARSEYGYCPWSSLKNGYPVDDRYCNLWGFPEIRRADGNSRSARQRARRLMESR